MKNLGSLGQVFGKLRSRVINWNKYPKTHPISGKDVLVFDGSRFRVGYWDRVSSNLGDWYDSSTDYIIAFVRNWTELPEPPEE